MDKKTKLIKIILETKEGSQVELTIDEAKELHEQLNAIFSQTVKYIPSAPIIINKEVWPQPYRPYWAGPITAYCGDKM